MAGLGRVSDAAAAGPRLAGPDRAHVLDRLDRVTALLTTARARWLLAERDAGTAVQPGDPSFVAAVARRTRGGVGAAARQVQQADALAALPAVAAAVERGTVPVAHLDVLARTVATASPSVEGALTSADGQARVVALARVHDAPSFGRELARWAATVDPASLERDHQAQRRNRYLHLSDQADGTRLSGMLDRMAGHRLRLALEATGEVPDDDRSPEQARADALVVLGEHALAAPGTRPGAAIRPHVSLVLTEDTFAQLRSAAERPPHVRAADGAAGSAAPVTAPPATFDDGTPVPASEVTRILCDCELTRVVVGTDGAPLDLGRTQRLYTGPQRRAVIVRDQVCAWGDCGRLARWCEVHHIRWWDRDLGPTDVDNGVLLCAFHHHEVHRRDLTILRTGLRGIDGARVGSGARAAYRFTTPDGQVAADSTRPAWAPGAAPRHGYAPSPPSRPRSPSTGPPPPQATASLRPRPHAPRTHASPDLFATADQREESPP